MQDNHTYSYLKLGLGTLNFAVLSEHVLEIVPEAVTARVPSDNPAVCGVMYYKQNMIPLLELSREEGTITVVCDYAGELVAYRATEVSGFLEVSHDMLEKNVQFYDKKTALLELEEEQVYLPDIELLEGKKVDSINTK